MPPSPLLSARMMRITYLSDTTIISAQKIVDNAAQDVCRVERDAVVGVESFLGRVERARADVAVDDAERGQRQACERLLETWIEFSPAPLAYSNGSLNQLGDAWERGGLYRRTKAGLAAYLGELACAGGHSVVRTAGDRGLAKCGHGAALRAPCRGPSRAVCREIVQAVDRCAANFGHKLVTVRKLKGPANSQALDYLDAGARFERANFGL